MLEIKSKSNRLVKDQFRVLNLVDGRGTLADLIEKARVPELELRKILTLLSGGGYIKEFANPAADGDFSGGAGPPSSVSTSSVDDLDFTQVLGPSKPAPPPVSQSVPAERGQREEAGRKAAEAEAIKARADATRRAQEEAARRALPALELLGDFIGNTFGGKTGIPAFDRCQVILDLKTALARDDGQASRPVGFPGGTDWQGRSGEMRPDPAGDEARGEVLRVFVPPNAAIAAAAVIRRSHEGHDDHDDGDACLELADHLDPGRPGE